MTLTASETLLAALDPVIHPHADDGKFTQNVRTKLQELAPLLDRELQHDDACELQRKARLMLEYADVFPTGDRRRWNFLTSAHDYLDRADELINMPGPGDDHESRSERAKKQLRDKHGKWIKMHAHVIVHSPLSGKDFTGKVTSIDVANNQVHIMIDGTSANAIADPKNIEAVAAVLHPPNEGVQTAAEKAPVPGLPYSDAELKALKDYTLGSNSSINEYLRGFTHSVNEDDQHTLDQLDSAIQKDKLTSDATLWRAAGAGAVPDSTLEPGTEITDNAFISTTSNKEIAAGDHSEFDNSIVFEIYAPAGTHVIDVEKAFNQHPDDTESEFVLNRGTTFRVISDSGLPDDLLNGQRHIQMEVIDDGNNEHWNTQSEPPKTQAVSVEEGGPSHQLSTTAEVSFDASTWQKVGSQAGSNPGGTYEDPSGQQWYIKDAATPDHARNEALASALYRDLGVNVPEVHVGVQNGKMVIGSKIIPGSVPDLKTQLKNEDYRDEIKKDFVTDAWLANWDVAGLEYDNVVTGADGSPWRIDTGGALLYRAMGAPKGSAFGDTVGELDTLRDPKMNPQSASIFHDLTDSQLKAQAQHLVDTMSDEKISELVDAQGFDQVIAEKLIETLKARRDYIANKFGVHSASVDTSAPEAHDTLEGLLPAHLSSPAGELKPGDKFHGTYALTSQGNGKPSGDVMTVDNVENYYDDSVLVTATDDSGYTETIEMDLNQPVWQITSGETVANLDVASGTDNAPGLSHDAAGTEPFQLGWGGEKLQVGHKVKSKTDGATGEIVKLEDNGLYVKVKMDKDGKIKGRKTSTLVRTDLTQIEPSTNNESHQGIAGTYTGGLATIVIHPDGSVDYSDDEGNKHYAADTKIAHDLRKESQTNVWKKVDGSEAAGVDTKKYVSDWGLEGVWNHPNGKTATVSNDGSVAVKIGGTFGTWNYPPDEPVTAKLLAEMAANNGWSKQDTSPTPSDMLTPLDMNGQALFEGDHVNTPHGPAIVSHWQDAGNGKDVAVTVDYTDTENQGVYDSKELENLDSPGPPAKELEPSTHGGSIVGLPNGGSHVLQPGEKAYESDHGDIVILHSNGEGTFYYSSGGLVEPAEQNTLSDIADGNWDLIASHTDSSSQVKAGDHVHVGSISGVVQSVTNDGVYWKQPMANKATLFAPHGSYTLAPAQELGPAVQDKDGNDLHVGDKVHTPGGDLGTVEKISSSSMVLVKPDAGSKLNVDHAYPYGPQQLTKAGTPSPDHPATGHYTTANAKTTADVHPDGSVTVTYSSGQQKTHLPGSEASDNVLEGIDSGNWKKQDNQSAAIPSQPTPEPTSEFSGPFVLAKDGSKIYKNSKITFKSKEHHGYVTGTVTNVQGGTSPWVKVLINRTVSKNVHKDNITTSTYPPSAVAIEPDKMPGGVISLPDGSTYVLKPGETAHRSTYGGTDIVVLDPGGQTGTFYYGDSSLSEPAEPETIEDAQEGAGWEQIGSAPSSEASVQGDVVPSELVGEWHSKYGQIVKVNSDGSVHFTSDGEDGEPETEYFPAGGKNSNDWIKVIQDEKAGQSTVYGFQNWSEEPTADIIGAVGEWVSDTGYTVKVSPDGSVHYTDIGGNEHYLPAGSDAANKWIGHTSDPSMGLTKVDGTGSEAPTPAPQGYVPAPGEKSIPAGDGTPIYKGAKVKSLKDGLEGTIVTLENNGEYVKVQGPDGKVKGRKASTLQVLAHPDGSAPKAGDIAAAQQQALSAPDAGDWKGKPPPTPPPLPPAMTTPFVDSAWLDKVKARFEATFPGKKLENSQRWARVQKVINDGSTTDAKFLLDNKYLDDALYQQAFDQINAGKAARQVAQKAHDALTKKYASDYLAWQIANTAPPPPAGPADWTQSLGKTPTLDEAISHVMSSVQAGNQGTSIAMDGTDVEDLDVRIMHVKDESGKDMLEIKFKLTPSRGEQLTKTLTTDPNWKSETCVIPKRKGVSYDSLGTVSSTEAGYKGYEGKTFKRLLPNGGLIRIHRANSKTPNKNGTNPLAYHNTVQIHLPANATKEDIATAIQAAGVQQARPATAYDMRIFAENRIASIFGKDTNAWTTLPAHEKAQLLAKIKADWGVGPEDLTVRQGADGRIELTLPQTAIDKLKAKTGVTHFTHSIAVGHHPQGTAGFFADLLSGNQQAMLSTTTRWAEGIHTSGMSSEPDISTGGADYIFTHMHKGSIGHYSSAIVFPAERLFARTDIYASPGDAWGKRVNNADIYGIIQNGAQEVIFKHRLDFADALGISVGQYRDEVIKLLKSRGITEIGGRPIDKFVLGSGMPFPTLAELGNTPEGVPISELMQQESAGG